jgi:hypothetical protein
MPVSARLYLPPHVSQRWTALAADGVDDCRVIESQRLVHHATLGETCTTARGHEMSTQRLVRQAVQLRRSLDDPATVAKEDQVGPLDTSHARRMIAAMWPQMPRLYPADIDFRELLARLEDGHCASLSGNPARIRADSSLKRAGDVGHEVGLSGIRTRAGVVELAVDDPYRHGGKSPRVEWRPATEVRQFAYGTATTTSPPSSPSVSAAGPRSG